MNILLCIDKKFEALSLVLIKSVLKHNSISNIQFYILYDTISQKYYKKVTALPYIHLIHVNLDIFNNCSDLPKGFSNIVYARLLCWKYLPNSFDKILYLDSDIIVKGSLKPLYDLNMDNNVMIYGAEDWSNSKDSIRKFNVEAKNEYINSGVLLLNLNLCRKVISEKEILSFSIKYKDIISYKDQDVINALYQNFIKVIPRDIYNYMRFASVPIQDINNEFENALILHYANYNKFKPWNINYVGKRFYKKFYKKYASDTLYYYRINFNMKINTILFPYLWIREWINDNKR